MTIVRRDAVPRNISWEEGMRRVMVDNGGFAPLKLIYDNIEKYRDKTGRTPDRTIQ